MRIKRKVSIAVLAALMCAFALIGVFFSSPTVTRAETGDLKELFAGNASAWKIVKLQDDTFVDISAAAEEKEYTYFTNQTETGKAIAEGDSFAFNGEVLVNGAQTKLAYCYTAEEAGTFYFHDVVQVDPLLWADPLPPETELGLFKIIKVSGDNSETIFPAEGANAEGYYSLKSEYAKVGNVVIDLETSLSVGDRVYFISGKENSTLYSSPVVGKESYADTISFRDMWRENQYLDKTYFDVMYFDNTSSGGGSVTPFTELEPRKVEWHIDNAQDSQAYLWINNGVQFLGAFGGSWLHAGAETGQDVGYRFTSPQAGEISLKLETKTASWLPKILIKHNGVKIWPSDKDSQAVDGLGTVTLNNFAVLQEGDTLDFILLGEGGASLKTYLNPIISFGVQNPIISGPERITMENGSSARVTLQTEGFDVNDLVWAAEGDGAEEALEIVPDPENNASVTVTHKAGQKIEGLSLVAKVKGAEHRIALNILKPIEESVVLSGETVSEKQYTVENSGTVYFTAALAQGQSVKIQRATDEVIAEFSAEGSNISGYIELSKGEVLTITDSEGNVLQASVTMNYVRIIRDEKDTIEILSKGYLMKVGEEQTLSYSIKPVSSAGKEVLFETSDATVISVDETGKMTALKRGKAEITVCISETAESERIQATVPVYAVEEGLMNFDSVKDFSKDGSEFWDYNYINLPSEEEPDPVIKELDWHSGGPFDAELEDGGMTSVHQFVVGSDEYTSKHQYLGIMGGIFVHPSEGADVILTFVAPVSGTVDVYDTIRAMHANSDGVNITVSKESATATEKIWPVEANAYLHDNKADSVLCIMGLELKKGDKLHFRVNKNETLSNDATYLDPKIVYTQFDSSDIDMDNVKIVLSKTEETLSVGGMFTLTAKVEGVSYTNSKIVFRSTDESVIKIDEYGIVTAVGQGSAQIEASWIDETYGMTEAKTAVCNVTVETEGGQTENPENPEGPKKDNNLGLWLGIGGGVVAVAAIAIVVFVVIKKKNR